MTPLMFKRKAPLIVAAIIVAGAASSLLLVKSPPRESDLLTPAGAFIVERYASRGHALTSADYRIEQLDRKETEAFMLAKVAPSRREHFLRLTKNPDWKVAADLHEDFEKYLNDKGVLKALPTRMIPQVREQGVQEPDNYQPTYGVEWAEGRMCGQIIVRFTDGQAPCIYREFYILTDGAWAQSGQRGNFMRMTPQSPPQRP